MGSCRGCGSEAHSEAHSDGRFKKNAISHCPSLFFHYFRTRNALVAKLVDAPDLGSGVARRVGSSPIRRTHFRSEYLSVMDNKAIIDGNRLTTSSSFTPQESPGKFGLSILFVAGWLCLFLHGKLTGQFFVCLNPGWSKHSIAFPFPGSTRHSLVCKAEMANPRGFVLVYPNCVNKIAPLEKIFPKTFWGGNLFRNFATA